MILILIIISVFSVAVCVSTCMLSSIISQEEEHDSKL